MSQLQVVYVGRVATFIQGDNVIYCRTEWVGIFQGEVHWLPADPAHSLRSIDPFLILLKLCSVLAVLIRSVPRCHNLHQHKGPERVRPSVNIVREEEN